MSAHTYALGDVFIDFRAIYCGCGTGTLILPEGERPEVGDLITLTDWPGPVLRVVTAQGNGTHVATAGACTDPRRTDQ